MKEKHLQAIARRLPVISENLDLSTFNTLLSVYRSMSLLKPDESTDLRSIWIELKSGSRGSKWYELKTTEYKSVLYFYFGSVSMAEINDSFDPETSASNVPKEVSEFLTILDTRVSEEVDKLTTDQLAYHRYIEKKLPYPKRFGRILRRDYWDILGDEARRPDIGLGPDLIAKFADVVEFQKNPEEWMLIREMTADDFFRFCEVCYDTAYYYGDDHKPLTPREKYWHMADGRHGGLMDIPGDSPGEFTYWFRSGAAAGAHPWEICRGGNSTHISLFVSEIAGGWKLILEGSSLIRVEETVRMAIALFVKGIPFVLRDATEILAMVKGEDFIGIVPEDITPRYCHRYFPKEDHIIDFMNLDPEYRKEIVKRAHWYPVGGAK